jgi:hypothetical protein
MVITITGSYDTRLKSYELLAEAFGLATRPAGATPPGAWRQPE